MFTILKKEIRSFLSSLIAYVVITVFLIAIGLFMWVLPEYNIFDMGDKLLEGKKKDVIDCLKRDETYMLFLANFSRDIRTYLKMKYLYNEKKLTISNNYMSFSTGTYPGIKKYFSDD